MSNTEAPTLFAQVELKWRRAKKLIYGERILRRVAEGNRLYCPRVIRRARNRWKRYWVDIFDDRWSPARSEQGVACCSDCRTGIVIKCKLPKRQVMVIYAYKWPRRHETPATNDTCRTRNWLCTRMYRVVCLIVITSVYFFTHQTCINSINYFRNICLPSAIKQENHFTYHLHYIYICNSAIAESDRLK